MRFVLVGVALLLSGAGCGAQTSAPEADVRLTLTNAAAVDAVLFDFERAELAVPHWGFEIRNDGRGRYYVKGEATEANASGNTWWDVSVGPATMETLFGGAGKLANGTACETKAKHIAQTGKKKLSYVHGAASSSCVFNYSDDERLNAIAAAFQAMAETMQAGERLKHKHRFDHLGLDAELDSLVLAAKDHRATEVQNISSILQSIVNDEELMSPSRRKADSLLRMAAQPAVSAR